MTKEKSGRKSSPSKGKNENLGEGIQSYLKGAKANTPIKLTPKSVWSLILWVAIPLYIGFWLSLRVFPQPTVGIIKLETGISSFTADFLQLQIDMAKSDPSIKAVVIQLNTPGGGVVSTQRVYLELLELRKSMPVVGSIGNIAASGGYYLAMATDPIYAKPSSVVGNIGVWGFVPPDFAVNDLILASGPFKLSASNEAEFVREIDNIKREFVETVRAGRGERLLMTDAEITTGLAYPGREAMERGMIDYLGSESEAIAMAAEMAGIRHYRVVDLQARVLREVFGVDFPLFEDWVYSMNPLSDGFALPPGVYLLYDMQLGGMP